jgi:RimJ/RimL family protein N-acetyltransferase
MMDLRPPHPPLSDGVVTLRPWNDGDVDAVYAACQDAEIAYWLPMIPVRYTRSDAHEYVRKTKQSWRDGTDASFAITDASTGEVVGSIGMRSHGDGRGTVGYWVAREARGRGAATRALKLISSWALDTLGFGRLELMAEPENEASCKVAERARYSREGVLRSYLPTSRRGRRDVVLFSLLPGDQRSR